MASPAEQALRTAETTQLKRLLVVDKHRFSRLIHRMLSDRYAITCVEDGLEAVKAMKYRRPDAVVAELNVRGGGVRLAELMDMNVRFAHTPFILMCINPTPDLVERVRQSGIDGVLVKPFPPSALVEQVGSVLEVPTQTEPLVEEGEYVGVAARIQERMKAIDGLPPFPATHAKVMELANSDEAQSEDIAEQIQMDPNFLATVLKLANSSHYGFSRRVDSLKLAVSLVGFKEIANLVMSLQVYQELGNYESVSKFDVTAFWKHSVGTAFMARAIAQKLNAEVEVAFLAGLLHDIGKVVLDRFFSEFFAETLNIVQEQQIPSFEAELEIMGITHAHLGGHLAANWNFAETLTEAIVCHHDPSLAKRYTKLASVAHVANAICNHLDYGSSGEVLKPGVEDPVLSKALWKLGIGPNSFGTLVELGEKQLEDADSFLMSMMGA